MQSLAPAIRCKAIRRPIPCRRASLRNALLAITSLVLCTSLAPVSAQQPITTPILPSAENFRDLAGISASNGGTGFADTTSNNGVMRTGLIYRSDVLALSATDLATISSLHIALDIDLRTPAEIATRPDVVPIGASYTNVNIYGTPSNPATPANTPAQAIASFQSMYQAFVTNAVERAAFHTVLIDIANDPDAAVYHCSAGKDRTGWTSALLQTIAGVPSATIMQDYLATNSYAASQISSTLAAIATQVGGGAAGANAAAIAAPIVGVQASFLQAALDQAIASYGSMNAYLIRGLGLTQADIYVLRARMVDYLTLPGQTGFTGNAASGAALLNELQNSPLSGHYTSYNYYLQSAIDAGTLGGVETQVGGQVFADAAANLLRQPVWIDVAIAPYTSGSELAAGQTRIWLTGLGGYFDSGAHAGNASSTTWNAGTFIGATYRIDDRASVFMAIGSDWGSAGTAGATADTDTLLATIGARYGFSTLEAGPYMAAHADVGGIDYQDKRALGGGLGTTRGNTAGAVYGGEADIGDIIRLAPVTVTPQAAIRVTQVTLNGFNETGSELALNVHRLNNTASSALAGVDVSLDSQQLAAWTITPTADLGLEIALGNPQVESTASLYSYTVNQYSAYNSRYLLNAGVGVTAQQGAVTVKAGINALHGDGSNGVDGQLAVAYRF